LIHSTPDAGTKVINAKYSSQFWRFDHNIEVKPGVTVYDVFNAANGFTKNKLIII
jgi:hypothetical protein